MPAFTCVVSIPQAVGTVATGNDEEGIEIIKDTTTEVSIPQAVGTVATARARVLNR